MVIAPQPEVCQRRDIVHLIQLDERNSMVYGPMRWHPCSCQEVKASDSSTARRPPGLGSGLLKSAGQDELNSACPEPVTHCHL